MEPVSGGEVIAGLVFLVVVSATVGWSLGASVRILRRKIRTYGRATGSVVRYVLPEPTYTVSQDGKGKTKVDLSASYHDWEGYSWGEEKCSVSLKAEGPTEIADALHEMYRAGGVEVTLRPFTKAKGEDSDAGERVIEGGTASNSDAPDDRR